MLLLLDASGLAHRQWHSATPGTEQDPTYAAGSFLNMVERLIERVNPSYVATIFDHSQPSFRHWIDPAYKGNRPPKKVGLSQQFKSAMEACEAAGLRAMAVPGFEADDVIASYCRHAAAAELKTVIVSSDKDLLQLISPRCEQLDPATGRLRGITEVRQLYGVDPGQLVDLFALCGDKIDNVPGVPGVGLRTAAELIREFGAIEVLLDRLDAVWRGRLRKTLGAHDAQIRRSKSLVRLDAFAPLPYPLPQLSIRDRKRAPVKERPPMVDNPVTPEAGHWRLYEVRAGTAVPARIWHDGRDWAAEIGGQPAAPSRVWERVLLARRGSTHWKAALPLTPHGGLTVEEEYRYQMSVLKWMRRHQPDHPSAQSRRAVARLRDLGLPW